MNAVFNPNRTRISVDRYQKMVATGVLTKHDSIELIEGEMIDMVPIGKVHCAITSQLHELFVAKLAGRANVVAGGPINLGDFSEPQPDIMLLKRREDFYRSKIPEAGDTLLVIEVADSSLGFDQGTKLSLYARYGVTEYWIVDVSAKRILVYRHPDQERYTDMSELRGAAMLAPLAFSDLQILVRDLFD